MNCHYVCLTCFVCDVTEEVNVETSAISFTLVPAYCMSTLLPRLFTSLRPDRFDCFNVEKKQQKQKQFLYAVSVAVLAGATRLKPKMTASNIVMMD